MEISWVKGDEGRVGRDHERRCWKKEGERDGPTERKRKWWRVKEENETGLAEAEKDADIYLPSVRSIKIKRLVAGLKSGYNGKAEIGSHGLKSWTWPFNLQMEGSRSSLLCAVPHLLTFF